MKARRRREQIKRAGVAWTLRDKTAAVVAFEGLCAYCQEEPIAAYDHVIPVSEGGETAPYNMLPCCIFCNSSKGDEEVLSWLCWKGWDDRWPALKDYLDEQAALFSEAARHLNFSELQA